MTDDEQVLFATTYTHRYAPSWWVDFFQKWNQDHEDEMMTWEYFKQMVIEELSEINETWRIQDEWYCVHQIGSIWSYIDVYYVLMLSLKDLPKIYHLVKFDHELKPYIKSDVEKQGLTMLAKAYWMAHHLEGIEGTEKSFLQKNNSSLKEKGE